jgi:DNA-binding MarR family transcriptional regulator
MTASGKKRAEPDVSRALNAVRQMVRGLRSAADTVERELNVSAAQLFVLRELAEESGRSVKDLADVTMTTHSTVSEVVAQLVAKGLVTKRPDENDARRAVLRLTRLGSNLVRKAPRAIQEDMIDGFGKLKPSEQRGIANGLEKWLRASGMGSVPAAMLFSKPLREATNRRRRTR